MKTQENWGWSGDVDITIYNLDGTVKEIVHIKNEIKNGVLNALRDALKGIVPDLQIKMMAWGSSNAANVKSQATLVAEFGRKAITVQSDGAVGVEITTTYIAPYEGNDATIEELGWFAGAATLTPNSGLLVGRVLWHRAKTNLESVTVTRTDTIA